MDYESSSGTASCGGDCFCSTVDRWYLSFVAVRDPLPGGFIPMPDPVTRTGDGELAMAMAMARGGTERSEA